MRTRLLAAVTAILVLACAAAWFVAEIVSGLVSSPDRTNPRLHRDVRDWHGGRVGYCDYSTAPGWSNWKLEWHAPDAECIVMLEVGDETPPSLEARTDGSLAIRRADKPTLVFESPHLLRSSP